MIYLDNAATTFIHPEVVQAMLPYLEENYGNAGSLYELGRRSASAIDKARRQVAKLINADPNTVIFTSGGSEANNLAIRGLMPYLQEIGKTHIITTNIEHDSIYRALDACTKPQFEIQKIALSFDNSQDLSKISEAIKEDTGLVSVMFVNNEIGFVNNVKEIARICHDKGVLFHTDCVQALGIQEIDVESIGCDFMSLSSHKIHGCKGMGCLYARNKELLTPIIGGGTSQEFGIRGGTQNVAGIVGFGEACSILDKCFDDIRYREKFLSHYFSYRLKEVLGDRVYLINQNEEDKRIVSVLFNDNIDAETMVLMLDTRGVCVSAGSACRSLEVKPSRVLKAIGLSDDDARKVIRVSFSSFNTKKELDEAIYIIKDCLDMLSMS